MRRIAGTNALANVRELGRGRRARQRGGDRARASASSTSARSSPASLPARRRSPPCSRARSRAGERSCVVSGGNVAAGDRRWYPGGPMKAGHPSRVRPRARHVLVRQRVLDPFHEAGAPRRDLRRVPSLLHGQAEARGHRAAAWSASSAGSRRPAARAAASPELPTRWSQPAASAVTSACDPKVA